MNSFIKEFYYGNIDPHARSFKQNKRILRDMKTLRLMLNTSPLFRFLSIHLHSYGTSYMMKDILPMLYFMCKAY